MKKTKKKSFIIIGTVIVIAAVIAVVCLKVFGGSHTAIDNNPESVKPDGKSNVLVAYFSWSGNGQQMARWISEETGGDIFRIVPKESYGDDYEACADRAKNELDNGIRPELAQLIDEKIMAEYDTIYIGFPVWWYDLPMSVWSFLENYDLSGKTIIPFFSHNGSSDGAGSVGRVAELSKGATVLADDALSIRGNSVSGSEKKVKEWAKKVTEKVK